MQLAAVDVHSTETALSHALLNLLFTDDELATGNLTKPTRKDIKILDQERVLAIRGT